MVGVDRQTNTGWFEPVFETVVVEFVLVFDIVIVDVDHVFETVVVEVALVSDIVVVDVDHVFDIVVVEVDQVDNQKKTGETEPVLEIVVVEVDQEDSQKRTGEIEPVLVEVDPLSDAAAEVEAVDGAVLVAESEAGAEPKEQHNC